MEQWDRIELGETIKARTIQEPRKSGEPLKILIYREWCKGCGICVEFCPRKALTMDNHLHPQLTKPDECTSCGQCEFLCPDFAITVTALRVRKEK